MEKHNQPHIDVEFETVFERSEDIVRSTREKFDRGEILQGRQYEPLPNSADEAFKETLKREAIIINLAKTSLEERR